MGKNKTPFNRGNRMSRKQVERHLPPIPKQILLSQDANNYVIWCEGRLDKIISKYPKHTYLKTGTDFVDQVTHTFTEDEVEHMSAFEWENAKMDMIAAKKNDAKYNLTVKEERVQIFHEIMESLSKDSESKVKANSRWRQCMVEGNVPIYNPFTLLDVIREIHIGYNGIIKGNVHIARENYAEKLANMMQGENQNLISYYTEMDNFRKEVDQFVKLNPVPTDADPTISVVIPLFSEQQYSIRFMKSLNQNHSSAVNLYNNELNQKKREIFKTLYEAYDYVSNFIEDGDVDYQSKIILKITKQLNQDKSKKTSNKADKVEKKPNDCKLCKDRKIPGNIKHWYPSECPLAKKRKKRENETCTEADKNTITANNFLDNLNDTNAADTTDAGKNKRRRGGKNK